MRKPLIAGNWKMHNTVAESITFLEELLAEEMAATVEVVVCPPYVALPAAAMMLTASDIGLGAQNVHWDPKGAFTGEIAAQMLVEIGVQWTIVGHSERRTLFSETDETTLARARAGQQNGLEAIFCVGETIEERDSGETFAVLERQTAGISGLDPENLVIAYEPVWAIGTGRTATAEQAQEAHAFLRDRLAAAFGKNAAGETRILYGGSLKPSNAAELLALPDVDGGLIGGASLDVSSFSAIIRAAAMHAVGEVQ